MVSEQAADFTLTDLEGQQVSLSDFKNKDRDPGFLGYLVRTMQGILSGDADGRK